LAAFDPAIWNNVFLVVATVVIVAIGLMIVQRVRQTARGDEAPGGEDLLGDLQRAYIKGEIDDAEFRRIQESLRRREPGASSGRTPPEDVPPPPSPPQAGVG
jgi:uncharacterized membrane protein